MRPVLHLLLTALLLATLLLPKSALAAVHCVTNAAELQAALNQAAASHGDDEIRLREGIYTPQQTLVYNASTAGWLFIEGGWRPEGANPCAQRGQSASNTVLDGAGQRQVLTIQYGSATAPVIIPRFSVANLSLRNGIGAGFVRGGGLSMTSSATHHTELWVDNVIVADNSGYFGGGANLSVRNGLIRVANSLFADNDAPSSAYGHLSITVVESVAANAVIVANSTFVNGACQGNTGGQRGCGLGAGLGGGVRMDIVNSLFVDNAVSDVTSEGLSGVGFGNGNVHYSHSRIPASTGTLPPSVLAALSGDPRFVDASGRDFRLRDDSPFINQGLGVVPIYGYRGYDLTGNLRVRFGSLDPGAYENQTWDLVFADGFQSPPEGDSARSGADGPVR